ncbi:SusD/RagB family nutrient-binding outer membrane lipoprotein [Sphingobacterium faecium]|uniref:SusD/RagB family nutrient-binding outer membrane lipoprotein n=1 Tax=Sphingobacterium faecium TaxID=34087 RepID=UPI00320B363F
MKKIFYIATISATLLFNSCSKWLDVNDNPNSANSTVPTPQQRLPSILAQFIDGYESAGTRTSFLGQQLAVVNANNNNWNLTRWNSTASSTGWPWQSWYVNTAVNIDPLIESATKVGAYHYVGAAKLIKAWGFGYMADLYGMLPYDEFDKVNNLTPKFDDGEYVYTQILALIDEAILDLSKEQSSGAAPLSAGDIFNKGNVQNWLKLAYGLKARFLNHYSKLPSYNPQAVLEALAKAPIANDESTIIQYVDETATTSDQSKASLQWVNTGTSARITQLYYNYITNNYSGAPSGSTNVIDPRLDLLVPSSQNPDGSYRKTLFVDMGSDLPKTGPASYVYASATNKFSNKDSVYISMRKDIAANGRILSTGTWYTEKGGKGLLLTNSEMKFIEAEVRFKKGELGAALSAYHAGIKAHMEIMGVKASDVALYMASSSIIQEAGKLTLSHIMIQKYIALSYSPEQWSDLRRMNYCTDASGNYNEATGIYKGFKRPSHVFTTAYPSQTEWPRRFAIPSYEINYNLIQVKTANAEADLPTYQNQRIWWDK